MLKCGFVSDELEFDSPVGTSPPTKTRRMDNKNGLVSQPMRQKSTKAVEVQTDPVRILPFDHDEFEEEKVRSVFSKL